MIRPLIRRPVPKPFMIRCAYCSMQGDASLRLAAVLRADVREVRGKRPEL